MPMINKDHLSIRIRIIGHADGTITCCVDRLASLRGEIKTLVILPYLKYRMQPLPVSKMQLFEVTIADGLDRGAGGPRHKLFIKKRGQLLKRLELDIRLMLQTLYREVIVGKVTKVGKRNQIDVLTAPCPASRIDSGNGFVSRMTR